MKTLIIAIALAAASAAASAESPTAAGPGNQAPTAVTARAAGTLIRAGELGQVPVPFVSVRDPADVRSEMLQSRRIAPYGLGYQPA